ncbi:MAG: IS21 family transposase [Acidobacteria bacterium]|nr:IS21 family transposase [Acidobacteriota bacterium]
MDKVYLIRHKVQVEGKSIRQVARELGLSRPTVKKYLAVSEPKRVESDLRPTPVKDQVAPRIDHLLDEWRTRTTPKQRITGTRLHRQLREEGYEVGITTVREYLHESRRRAQEVFIPLIYRRGEVAQVDFFDVTVEEAGQLHKAWKFLMHLMYSSYEFVWLYERCDQLSFLDAHVRAFNFFGGIPRRLAYDNLSAAVQRIIGPERELTQRFTALVSHYLFEPCFARPGEGHDKGGVESRGKAIRLQHLVPIPRGESLRAISDQLLADLQREYATKKNKDGESILVRFAEERNFLRPLPAMPFDVRRTMLVAVSSRATVQIDGATYSVPSTWARLDATACVGVEEIQITCRGQEVVYPKERSGGKMIQYRNYLPELAHKPQAVRQVAPELIVELGEPFEQLWQLLCQTHGEREAARVLSRILGAIVDHGEAAVSTALRCALAEGRIDLLALAEKLHAPSSIITGPVPEALRGYEVEASRASDYDWLLKGGVR